MCNEEEKLKQYVMSIAMNCGRKVGTEGHKIAREYLGVKMEEMGLIPYNEDSYEMSYNENGTEFFNLAGFIPSDNPKNAPVIVGAHYDSVIEAPCADDNAAAVAINLLLMEKLCRKDLQRDIVFVFFDAEEPPYYGSSSMGSRYFYHNQMDYRGVHCAIITDLVGHDVSFSLRHLPVANQLTSEEIETLESFIKPLLFMTGAESCKEWSNILRIAGEETELRTIALLNEHIGDVTDHGVFRENGHPYLMLSCGRWEHYHKTTDTPDKLNYSKMLKISNLLRAIIHSTQSRPLTIGKGDFSIELEKEWFEKNLGDVLKVISMNGEVPSLDNRENVNNICTRILSFGL
jgi:hypothetical protein